MAALAEGSALGHFRIERLLGAGGMGEVYLASDTALDRQVALKVLRAELCRDEERCARFRREARAAAALSHPNICTIHEIGEADGQSFICMEYVGVADAAPASRRRAAGRRGAARPRHPSRGCAPR
ncbi:MAG: protein kinase, partial [Acidobacteriota bacterium]